MSAMLTECTRALPSLLQTARKLGLVGSEILLLWCFQFNFTYIGNCIVFSFIAKCIADRTQLFTNVTRGYG